MCRNFAVTRRARLSHCTFTRDFCVLTLSLKKLTCKFFQICSWRKKKFFHSTESVLVISSFHPNGLRKRFGIFPAFSFLNHLLKDSVHFEEWTTSKRNFLSSIWVLSQPWRKRDTKWKCIMILDCFSSEFKFFHSQLFVSDIFPSKFKGGHLFAICYSNCRRTVEIPISFAHITTTLLWIAEIDAKSNWRKNVRNYYKSLVSALLSLEVDSDSIEF